MADQDDLPLPVHWRIAANAVPYRAMGTFCAARGGQVQSCTRPACLRRIMGPPVGMIRPCKTLAIAGELAGA
jgi:hypothetical protein